MTYWFMTFCHELAHNFIKPHSAEHEVSIKYIYNCYLFQIMYVINNSNFFT